LSQPENENPSRKELMKAIQEDFINGTSKTDLVEKYSQIPQSTLYKWLQGLSQGNSQLNENISFEVGKTVQPKKNPYVEGVSHNQDQAEKTRDAEKMRDYITGSLLEGASYAQVAEATGYPEADLRRAFPPEAILATREQMMPQLPAIPQMPMQQDRNIPSGHLIIPPGYLDALAKDAPKAFKSWVQGWKNNLLTYNSQVAKQTNPTIQPSNVDTFDYQLAQLIKQERAERIMNMGKGKNTTRDPVEQLLTYQKLMKEITPQQPRSDLDIYMAAEKHILDKEVRRGAAGSSNMVDLKIAEMNQDRELDLERIRWEQKKFLLEHDRDEGKWEKITGMFGPILQANLPAIKHAVTSVAQGVSKSIAREAENIGNPRQNNPETMQIACPTCSKPMGIPSNVPQGTPVKCPSCSSMFDLGSSQGQGEMQMITCDGCQSEIQLPSPTSDKAAITQCPKCQKKLTLTPFGEESPPVEHLSAGRSLRPKMTAPKEEKFEGSKKLGATYT